MNTFVEDVIMAIRHMDLLGKVPNQIIVSERVWQRLFRSFPMPGNSHQRRISRRKLERRRGALKQIEVPPVGGELVIPASEFIYKMEVRDWTR